MSIIHLPIFLFQKGLKRLPWPVQLAWSVWVLISVADFFSLVHVSSLSDWAKFLIQLPWLLIRLLVLLMVALVVLSWFLWPARKLFQYMRQRG